MRIKHILVSILFTAFILSCESKIKVDKALALEVPTTYEDPCDALDDHNLVSDALYSVFPKDLEEMESEEFDMKAFLEENQDVMDDLKDLRNSIEKSMRKSSFSKKRIENCDKFEDVNRKRKELRKYL